MSTTTKTLRQKLLAVQNEVGAIRKDKNNPFFNKPYFDINSLLAELKPVLHENKLVLIQPLSVLEDGTQVLTTSLLDTDSDDEISHSVIIPEAPKTKETGTTKDGGAYEKIIYDVQKAGSAITYYRRYALQTMFALESEDDDGNAAAAKKVQAEEQQAKTGGWANAKVTPAAKPMYKPWFKYAEGEKHECKKCASPAKRKYGLSKQNKHFNILVCTEDKKHINFLDPNPAEANG